MKSGTTYLSELLATHPEIFICSPREPCHFVDPRVLRQVWRLRWRMGYWRSSEHYLSLFAGAGGAKVIAEGSTLYTQAPLFEQVPERILATSADARFVYILRDPIERTISHYWHRVQWWGERRPLNKAILADRHYLNTSDYAYQLGIYLRHVPRERIYVLTLEDLIADPLEELHALFAWLGVDAGFRPESRAVARNLTPETLEMERGFGVLNRIRHSPLYARIEPAIPAWVRKPLHRLATREIRPADVPLNAVEAYLRPIQLQQTAELSRLLGRSFARWTTLFAGSAS